MYGRIVHKQVHGYSPFLTLLLLALLFLALKFLREPLGIIDTAFITTAAAILLAVLGLEYAGRQWATAPLY